MSAAGRGTALVDGTVTIVVHAVAADFSRERSAAAGIRTNPDARATASARARVTHGAVGEAAAGRAADMVLVDLAIAIVVHAVADFGRARARGAFPERPVPATVHGAGASAHATAHVAETFVHLAVAIVIQAVA